MLYLNKKAYEALHGSLSRWANGQGEPIPSFQLAKQSEIDNLVDIPKQEFYGIEAYPTLAEKAAIIFYTINKKQIFLNGNKRMSTLSLLVFLFINDKDLNITPDVLTEKALWLAKTASQDFPQIKVELVEWITSHLIDIK